MFFKFCYLINYKLWLYSVKLNTHTPFHTHISSNLTAAYGQQQSQLQPSGGGQVVMQAAKHSNQQLQSQQNAVATSAATMNLMSKTTIGQQQVVITKPHHVSTPSIQRGQLENPRDKKVNCGCTTVFPGSYWTCGHSALFIMHFEHSLESSRLRVTSM